MIQINMYTRQINVCAQTRRKSLALVRMCICVSDYIIFRNNSSHREICTCSIAFHCSFHSVNV